MSSLPFRALVFDFDLTLVDSRAGFVDAHEYARTRLGLPGVSPEAEARTIGTPLHLAFEQLYPGREAALMDYVELWQRRADERMTDLTSVLPGAPETVRDLHDAGFLLGIVSQKRHYRVEAVLQREGLLECFAAIIGGDEAPEFKPDPSGILMLLDRLQVPAIDTVYVGDTLIDAEAARRAGMPFVAVLTGYAKRPDFQGVRTLAVLESVVELPALLGVRAALD